jgi:hypothetical protein
MYVLQQGLETLYEAKIRGASGANDAMPGLHEAARGVERLTEAPNFYDELIRLYPDHSFSEIADELGTTKRCVSRAAHWLERQGKLTLRTPKERSEMMAEARRGGTHKRYLKPAYSMTKTAISLRAKRARMREQKKMEMGK